MTERTCRNCAWWRKNRDGWTSGRTASQQLMSRCESDNSGVMTAANDSCRDHATTRVWAADANEPLSKEQPEVAPGAFLWKGAEDEITRLNAQLQEALQKLGEASVEVEELKERCLEAENKAGCNVKG